MSTAMKLNIPGIVGQNCMTPEQGQDVYDRIHQHLLDGQPVELDFDGVDIFASPFFNYAVGQLLKDISPSELNRLLSISNLNPVGLSVLQRVIENSKQYYSDPRFREAVDEVLEREAILL
jgi:hypothetical protein